MEYCICRCCGYKVEIDNSYKELVKNILQYDVQHDTYAAMILRKNWVSIQKYPEDSEEFQSQDNNAPDHVAIMGLDDNSEYVPLRPKTMKLQHSV